MKVGNYFTYVRRLLMVVGIWKVESPDISFFGKRIYQVYSFSIQLFCYSAALSLLVEIPSLMKTDVAAAMDNANRFTVYIVIIIKMIAWQTRRMVDLLKVLLDQNQQMQASCADLHIRRLYRKHARYNHKLMFLLVSSGTVIAISIAGVGGVNIYHFIKSPDNINATEKPLPYRYWYPFDRNKYYLVALVDQNIRPTLSCFCVGVTSASLNSLAIFVSIQLKVLQHQFEHFNRQKQEALDSLKLLCEKHQGLIAYTSEFSESLKYIVMLDYMVCSVTFALLILQIIDGQQLLINFTIFTFTMLTELQRNNSAGDCHLSL
ncbi:uncharacterized protein LOC132705219 isoform X2 [Cylas formicarius]|uniref:uncharacterized protein LOC132705219 isoform X2 n=1 Tax=Cylas formicarius TaxID=197179 RepID=UPI002958D3CA|nr:uncharacterized protein LOC132705219 isoform X2 [Cylas formicarius]